MKNPFDDIFKGFRDGDKPIEPRDQSSIMELIENMKHNIRHVKATK